MLINHVCHRCKRGLKDERGITFMSSSQSKMVPQFLMTLSNLPAVVRGTGVNPKVKRSHCPECIKLWFEWGILGSMRQVSGGLDVKKQSLACQLGKPNAALEPLNHRCTIRKVPDFRVHAAATHCTHGL